MSRVAAIQMISSAQVSTNLQNAEILIADAVKQGVTLILLPEMFAIFDSAQLIHVGENEKTPHGPIRHFLAQQAKKHKVWIIGGTIPTAQAPVGDVNHHGKIYAACFVYDAQGHEVSRYDKIHLFDVTVDDNQATYNESSTTYPGNQVVTVDTPVGKVGLAVCYDVRFPELFRKLHEQGAQIIVLPSAFTEVTGRAHWDVLVRARAIENFCYVIAANQGGVHDNHRRTFGHSMVVDSWGNVISCVKQGAGVAVADIDLTKQHDIRQKMPTHQHRRL